MTRGSVQRERTEKRQDRAGRCVFYLVLCSLWHWHAIHMLFTCYSPLVSFRPPSSLHKPHQIRGSNKVVDQDPEGKYEALSKYARDLTAAARDGKLDPVIGRDDEIRRCIQILSRRTKNNPVLIGEPGGSRMCIVLRCIYGSP